jgi:phenylacetate-CoA ligase
MTSFAEERAEQQRWSARLRHAMPVYDRLLENEFETPERVHARIAQSLGAMLRFASRQVPYYSEAFRRAGDDAIDRDPWRILAALPVLTKLDVHDNGPALRAKSLPQGEVLANWTRSSGTTGRPTRVLHSRLSTRMFTLLKQREYRWFRLDPSETFAAMRVAAHLPRSADGGELKQGETVRLQAWPYMENFTTGPYVAIDVMTAVEERIAWLRRECPAYLMSYSESLEHLALATGGKKPAKSLNAVIAISEQLTSGMRDYVERSFGIPVHQNYGLNEIGLVAVRCKAGRYHVHSEHCLVEIVDDEGRVCAPGEKGRIVVTGLTNFAMPLIRYDTGDLAEATAGECSCGCTLPTFGEIVGRYSRFAFLPAGTIGPVLALRDAIEQMPPDLTRDLREFQIHQYLDNRIELRLVTRSPLPEAFFLHIRGSWAKATDSVGPTLTFRHVDVILRSPGGKFQVFTSDFIPAPD